MSTLRGSLRFSALTVLFLLTAPFAEATNIVFDRAGNVVGSYVGRASLAADWVYSGGRAGAVAVSSGVALAEGLSVPTAFEAAFTADAVAGIAGKVAGAASGLGTAFLAYQTYKAIKDSGLHVCSASQGFFCKQPDSLMVTYLGSGSTTPSTSPQSTSDETCRAFYPSAAGGAHSANFRLVQGVISASNNQYYFDCVNASGSGVGGSNGTESTTAGVGPERVATDAEVRQSIVDKENADHDYGRRVMEAMRADAAQNPQLFPPGTLAPADTPIAVTAPPVTGPSTTSSTSQQQNPDGTTSTVKKDVQTTVTPSTTGTTIGDSNTTYNITNVTTTTVTNNQTGAVTTSTDVSNKPGAQTSTPGTADTGPKECGSPGHPACKIDETGVPTTIDLAAPKSELQKTLDDAKTAVTDASSPAGKDTGWKFSFNLPTSCSTFTLFLGVVVDFCSFKPMVHDLMSMVWVAAAVFCMIGMVGRTVRGSA